MVKKKLDSRIRTLIENCVTLNHRSIFVLIGDRGRDQIVNLHYILSKCRVESRPSVLWCYSKDLGFTTHRQKRLRKIKKEISRGIREVDEENPFELFLGSTNIRYCYYKETESILGQTFGMLVLQDFQSLTPNLLARTIETIQGGGIVVFLIQQISSLKQLYSMTMDVHKRYKTEAYHDVSGRFNERFMLSLANCQTCVVMDDELNLLPISSQIRKITKINKYDADSFNQTNNSSTEHNDDIDEMESDQDHMNSSSNQTKTDLSKDKNSENSQQKAAGFQQFVNASELELLKTELRDTKDIGSLVDKCRSLDQAKAVLTFIEAISEKSLRSTVVLTAARGRGKSASLGLSIAAAVSYGYSNIFVTSPSPENLRTLFEMIFAGFDSLGYKEHSDYEILTSPNPKHNKSVVRVNIYHSHRQTIQYVDPRDSHLLSQAELVCIDEAAAIPLPTVKKLIGNYLIFMSSTVNGYEGTGRSLSLKLVKQLRTEANNSVSSENGRKLREVTLQEPIRYGLNDHVESWLNNVLCLNCSDYLPVLSSGLPHPSTCNLFYIERDTLFSYHNLSELFLQQLMSLYVSSHYKNTPNDLQLMSDAPAHRLFALLGPQNSSSSSSMKDGKTSDQAALPDLLCVIQVCLEGNISKQSTLNTQSRGEKSNGDLIPWSISQQFQSSDFAQLSGARIVRIATHPDTQRMGYAKRAMDLLSDYYQGKITNLDELSNIDHIKVDSCNNPIISNDEMIKQNTKESQQLLLTESIKPRSNLLPLLHPLCDRQPEQLSYIGVSYGLTLGLFNFWSKLSFVPLYLRMTANELTGEHTCIMLQSLNQQQQSSESSSNQHLEWLSDFKFDFQKRFVHLLQYDFAKFPIQLALSLLVTSNPQQDSKLKKTTIETSEASRTLSKWNTCTPVPFDFNLLTNLLSAFDLRRLESYSLNLVDYHLILDLLPRLSYLTFTTDLISKLDFSYTQLAILCSLGLQHKNVSQLEPELQIQQQQILSQFNKICRKYVNLFRQLEEDYLTQHEQQQHKSNKRQNFNSNHNTLNTSTAGLNHQTQTQKTNGTSTDTLAVADKEFSQYHINNNDNEENWNNELQGKERQGIVSVKKNPNQTSAATDSTPKYNSSDSKSKHKASDKKHKHHKSSSHKDSGQKSKKQKV